MSDRNDKLTGRGERAPESAEELRDPALVDPDAPPTEEEIAASRRLRDALEAVGTAATDAGLGDDLALVASLRAAWSPSELDERAHAELLDDLPTAEEQRLAAELRDALASLDASSGGATPSTDAALAATLRAAWSPRALGDAEHRAIVDRALGSSGATVVALDAGRRRARARAGVVVVTTSVLALAASVVLWIGTAPSGRDEAPLARVRSTQPLFDEPFKPGEASARIDRIAAARASDYRDNRFAKWGVR